MAGLRATLQSNKSPTSNSSIKVSPKTFKVIHSFSKKETLERFCNITELLELHYLPWYHSFLPTSFIFTLYTYLWKRPSDSFLCLRSRQQQLVQKIPCQGWCITKVQIHILLFYIKTLRQSNKNLNVLKGSFVKQKRTTIFEKEMDIY